MKRLGLFFAAAFCLMMMSTASWGQTCVSITTLSGNYTENFNTLASSGTSSTVPAGWAFSESGGSGNTTYTAGTGSSATGDTYSFGAAASTERAFGQLRSGSVITIIGGCFINNTGQTITNIAIGYTGEQWRLGATGRVDMMDFQYSTNATSITTGTWTDVNALDFTAPTTSGTVGALDGNASANRTRITSTITGLSITNGSSFYIRWTDLDATGADDGLGVDDFGFSFTSPTAVRLSSFTATEADGGVLLQWRTGYEVDNLGYNIYRKQGRKLTRINPSPVAGSALLAGPRSVLTAGQNYSWVDAQAKPGTQYYLEDIDLNGTRTMHGPIVPVKIGGRVKLSAYSQAKFLSQLGSDSRASRTSLPAQSGRPASVFEQERGARALNQDRVVPIVDKETSRIEQQRVLAAESTIKLMIRQPGWYRVTQEQLVAAGFDTSVDTRYLQLFVDGQEVPIRVAAARRFSPGSFLEFYGTGMDTPSSDTRTYWLMAGTRYGKRISTAQRAPQTSVSPSFAYTVERKDRTLYFSSLHNGEADNFFGAIITGTPVNQALTLRNINVSSKGPATLEVALQGVTLNAHQVRVLLNDVEVGVMNFQGQGHPIKSIQIPNTSLVEGNNTVTLIALGGDTDVSVVDYLRLTYARTYHAENDRLTFSKLASSTVRVDGFTSPNIRVYDITDPYAVKEIAVKPETQGAGYSVTIPATFTMIGTRVQSRTLIALTDSQAQTPAGIKANEPSSLSSSNNGADFVIITPHNFKNSAETLADLRRGQGLSVTVVDVEDVYDEFSYGAHSTQAIKDFLSYASSNWNHAPHYVLLMGDASFDPRNYLGFGNLDFVPTKLVDTAYLETASDDDIVDFNNDGLPEMAVGRLPVRTEAQAATVVSKIINYVPGQVGQGAMLVADYDSSYDFEAANNAIRALLPTGMPVQMINRGTNDTSTVHAQIINGLNNGPMLVNYVGHGSVEVWTGGGLLSSSDASALTNGNRLPLVVTMTCLNGFFHDVYTESLAEALLKADNGGAVAVWSSSGLTEPDAQAGMNQKIFQLLFSNEQSPALGDAVMAAKEATTGMDVRRTWILFGDPTMRLR